MLASNEENDMQASTLTEVAMNDLELWTMDDAEAWNEAALCPDLDIAMDDDPMLDNDFWMESDSCEVLSIEGLGRLGIRI